MDDVAGVAAVQDAQVVADETPVPTEDHRVALEAAVEAARRKVEKQKAHLAGAEQALAEAEAALQGEA